MRYALRVPKRCCSKTKKNSANSFKFGFLSDISWLWCLSDSSTLLKSFYVRAMRLFPFGEGLTNFGAVWIRPISPVPLSSKGPGNQPYACSRKGVTPEREVEILGDFEITPKLNTAKESASSLLFPWTKISPPRSVWRRNLVAVAIHQSSSCVGLGRYWWHSRLLRRSSMLPNSSVAIMATSTMPGYCPGHGRNPPWGFRPWEKRLPSADGPFLEWNDISPQIQYPQSISPGCVRRWSKGKGMTRWIAGWGEPHIELKRRSRCICLLGRSIDGGKQIGSQCLNSTGLGRQSGKVGRRMRFQLKGEPAIGRIKENNCPTLRIYLFPLKFQPVEKHSNSSKKRPRWIWPTKLPPIFQIRLLRTKPRTPRREVD